jgi:hypothetical protein
MGLYKTFQIIQTMNTSPRPGNFYSSHHWQKKSTPLTKSPSATVDRQIRRPIGPEDFTYLLDKLHSDFSLALVHSLF